MRIPRFCLQVTYQCNAECKHCGPRCGPRERDWMTEEEMRRLVLEADAIGTEEIIFSGGEPTLLKNKLTEMLSFIRDRTSVRQTRLVTNAKWASSPAAAVALLSEWKDAGLTGINVSCGEYHLEYIPIESVVNAYVGACSLDFEMVTLAGEFLGSGPTKVNPGEFVNRIPAELFRAVAVEGAAPRKRGFARYEAMNHGRGAAFVPVSQLTWLPEERIPSKCSEVLTTITAHPEGSLTACCGVMVRNESLLHIGSWRTQPLSEIMEAAQDDVFLNWIRHLGLHDMKAWLLRKNPELPFRSQYQNICDLCADIFSNKAAEDLLLAHGHERADEVLVRKMNSMSAPHGLRVAATSANVFHEAPVA